MKSAVKSEDFNANRLLPSGWQQIIDKIPLRIFWKDTSSAYLGCNLAFAMDAGETTESILGKTDFDLPWSEMESKFYQTVDRRVMENNRSECNIIEPQMQEDGTEYWLDTSKWPLHDELGTVVGVLCCYDIVTERGKSGRESAIYQRHLEKLLHQQTLKRRQLEHMVPEAQKTESLRLMAGGIAHDFNNMLAAIMANAELLKLKSSDSQAVADIGEGIISSCQMAAELCGQLSVFSGCTISQEQFINVNEQLRQMLPLLTASVNGTNIDYSLSPLDPICWGCSSKLQQLLLNLVVNASESSPDDSWIHINTEVVDCSNLRLNIASLNCAEGSGKFAQIEIVDSGQGIDEDLIGKIFDPFFSTKGLGRGLGLAAVSGIVSAFNGAVEVVPNPLGGTIFRVLLPLTTNSNSSVLSIENVDVSEFETRKIILIDDDECFARNMERLLVARGHLVSTFLNVGSAIFEICLDTKTADLILMDIQMPKIDGLTALREIRKLGIETPVILVTGFVEEKLHDKLDEIENVQILEKPFSVIQLEHIFSDCLP